MKRKPRYTFEECQTLTEKYDSYDTFKEEQPDMFNYIRKHCWCHLLYSHMTRINKRLKYNVDDAKKVISKYKILKDFRLNEEKLYSRIIQHKDSEILKGLLPSKNSYHRYIYAYEFKDLNKVYVGLTWNVERRHNEHKLKGTVFNFLQSNNIKELQEPVILEGPVKYDEAGEREGYWMKKYLLNKWELINKASAGSLGGDVVGEDITVVFKNSGEFVETLTVKEASEKYLIKRNLIRIVMSGRNKSTNGLRFLKKDEWIKMGKPSKIEPFYIPNAEEEIVLLDNDFNVRKIVKNKPAAAEYEGYTNNGNNNITILKHHLVLNTKNGGKCAYYDDYKKFKEGEWVLVKPGIPKCKTLLLVPKYYKEEDFSRILEKPSWWKNRSQKRSLEKREIGIIWDKKNFKDETVQQFSFDGTLINEYKNAKDAANNNNISIYALNSCLACRSYTSGGYIWLYKETYSKEILDKKISAAKRIKERELRLMKKKNSAS